jgi:hypothetical protein
MDHCTAEAEHEEQHGYCAECGIYTWFSWSTTGDDWECNECGTMRGDDGEDV